MRSNKEIFNLEEDYYYRLSLFSLDKYPQEFWDVSETISELAYLTHNFFRYYGKFPSKIGKLIIEDLKKSNQIHDNEDFILDNYSGSGTSLVEAKLHGFDSYGIDINPFAVLACKVKTQNYDIVTLERYWEEIYKDISACNSLFFENEIIQGELINNEAKDFEIIKKEISQFKDNNKDANKWFSERAIIGLSIIKHFLLKKIGSKEREFFELAFFSIIRRVSTAHDGEVRPHVNNKKRERNVFDAYEKKIVEMIKIMKEWNVVTKSTVLSESILCDNASHENVSEFVENIVQSRNKQLGLVISHPPYLNCFDYIPVYKLKFMWADGFDDIFYGYTLKDIKTMEIKSYPANSHEKIERYFMHNIKCYQNIFDNLKPGGYCCVVIGDCTLREKLFEVHKTFIKLLEEIGFNTIKIVYRSTAYGIGQYAYKHRADYNEDANRKKDAVLFFQKPQR